MDRYVPLPPLPARIGRLNELAYDLWWSWNREAREVFRDLDYPLWRFTNHNPVLVLHLIEPERLEHAAADAGFLALYDRAVGALDSIRIGAGTWWAQRRAPSDAPVVLVTPEFAVHQSLPVDAHAAGVLAGDYVKEASDLGIPLVGVGLMYPRNHARQRISAEGWQQEHYDYIDWSDAPIAPALTHDGARCTFTLTLAEGPIHVAVWQVRAGRVSVYLLDTDLPENSPWDREMSSRSVAEDADARLRQGMLLGGGAVKALEMLGIRPAVWHAAEPPAAFVCFERIQRLLEEGASFGDAVAEVTASTLFSEHEGAALRHGVRYASAERQIAAAWPALMSERQAALAMGRDETDRGPTFNPAAIGARLASSPGVPGEGVHLPTWVSTDLARVFDGFIGADWRDRQEDETIWGAIHGVPDAQLWGVREKLRGYLVDFVRERARRRWAREQASGSRLVALGTLLDGAALTIGYAHRFVEDARPALIFQDLERLARIVTAPRRPVQIIFAGRAASADESAKHHLQRVFRRALDPAFGGRIAFLEDYDLHVARLMVQGCDVWLTTSRPGHPASLGGLKSAVNGAAQLATPGGWWADGWNGRNGWMIDTARGDAKVQDAAEARVLYELLEEQIVPAFYDRDRYRMSARWMSIVKESIAAAVPKGCARRTLKALVDGAYLPAISAAGSRGKRRAGEPAGA